MANKSAHRLGHGGGTRKANNAQGKRRWLHSKIRQTNPTPLHEVAEGSGNGKHRAVRRLSRGRAPLCGEQKAQGRLQAEPRTSSVVRISKDYAQLY